MLSLQCKTHTTVLCLRAGGEIYRAWGCLLVFPPPLLPDLPYFRVQWPQLMWFHSCNFPPPSHICALCRNHMCPQSLKQEVKDDLEEAFRKLSKKKWRMLSRGLDSHGQDSYSTRGLQKQRLLQHCPCQQESCKETGGQPRKMKNTPQRQVPRLIPASNRAAYFLWQERLFIWGK